MNTHEDQRSYLREALLQMEILLQSSAREFRLMEISLGGLALASPEQFSPGQRLVLDFQPYTGIAVETRSCFPLGDDTHYRGWNYRIGARFLEPDQGLSYYTHAMDLYMETLEDVPDESLDERSTA